MRALPGKRLLFAVTSFANDRIERIETVETDTF